MKNSICGTSGRYFGLALMVTLSCAFMAPPSLSGSGLQATITVTNNSDRDINHLYTSPISRKEWTADQLPEGAKLASGASFTLSNVICEGDQVRVIAEDKDGCFMYQVASCQESATWTITNTTSRDCGN